MSFLLNNPLKGKRLIKVLIKKNFPIPRLRDASGLPAADRVSDLPLPAHAGRRALERSELLFLTVPGEVKYKIFGFYP
jgi:hypothetical protein